MRTEKELQKLEDELKAIKMSFEQSAVSLNIQTVETSFTTHASQFTYTNSSSYDPFEWQDITFGYLAEGGTAFYGPYYGNEIIQVTFRSNTGSNTLASLEINDRTEGGSNSVHIMRVPFDGGARWVLSYFPCCERVSGVGEYTWSPTVIDIAVQSIMPGSLEVVQL